ncbi:MAG TPA: hypothetical protein VMZ33_00350, partial [Candidatus Limnocylindrales bacterium]|nr:hypothetical protein [Candidatus Limnocylindrales bacterium]
VSDLDSDEALVNFGTPAYSYGHEVYDDLAVTSNGYVVVGTGTSEDLDYVPQDFPDPARPNNVIAPYWTDLDPASGGDIRIGTLTDGVDTWIVVDWQDVHVYGTTNDRSFQVWIQIGGTAEEGIWLEHDADAVAAAGASDGLIVGAENRDGSSGADLGMDVPPANTGYRVITGNPTAGGSKTITYEALGQARGAYYILASMTSDITQGTATDRDRIRVTP